MKIHPQTCHTIYNVYSLKDDNNVLWYIGYARLSDIVGFKDVAGNPAFKTDRAYTITLHSQHEKTYEAGNAVAALIKRMCLGAIPPLNLTQRFNRYMPVRCLQTGIVYRLSLIHI